MALFGTAGIRGPVETTTTPELAMAVGRAVGIDADERGDDAFVVGRDGRITGSGLQRALVAGLQSSGVAINIVGRVPTPALAFASRGRRGIMLTASHNPPADNGIKLFHDGREYDRDAERRIEDRIAADEPSVAWDAWTKPSSKSVIESYRDAVVEFASAHGAPLTGLRLVVDCGNGMASTATPAVLRALGGNVTSLSANIDGRFPARDSKPTPASLADLREFVAAGDWALGFGADGDADRLVVVDGGGHVVHEDTVLAILAEYFARESDGDDRVVVTTPNASTRVDERVEAVGGRVERVALGYLHEGIDSARAAGNTVVFAGEPWKHIHPELGGWIDGIASAAVLARLVASAGGVGPLREAISERSYRKVNVECPDDDKADVMTSLERVLTERFSDAANTIDDGVRIELPDGSWVLVRPSGTEPYIRVYAEGENLDELIDETVESVESCVANHG